jgi:hypothetical protein
MGKVEENQVKIEVIKTRQKLDTISEEFLLTIKNKLKILN